MIRFLPVQKVSLDVVVQPFRRGHGLISESHGLIRPLRQFLRSFGIVPFHDAGQVHEQTRSGAGCTVVDFYRSVFLVVLIQGRRKGLRISSGFRSEMDASVLILQILPRQASPCGFIDDVRDPIGVAENIVAVVKFSRDIELAVGKILREGFVDHQVDDRIGHVIGAPVGIARVMVASINRERSFVSLHV